MLVLAFDTATDVATVALTRGNELLGERLSSAGRLLREVDELLRLAEATPDQIEAIAVGTGPGRYTSLRMGLSRPARSPSRSARPWRVSRPWLRSPPARKARFP